VEESSVNCFLQEFDLVGALFFHTFLLALENDLEEVITVFIVFIVKKKKLHSTNVTL